MKKHVKHIQASEIKNLQTNPIIVNSTTSVHSAHDGDHKSLVTPRNHIHSCLVKKFLMPVTRMRMMTSRMNQFVKRRPRFVRQIRVDFSRKLDIKALPRKCPFKQHACRCKKASDNGSEISKWQQFFFECAAFEKLVKNS